MKLTIKTNTIKLHLIFMFVILLSRGPSFGQDNNLYNIDVNNNISGMELVDAGLDFLNKKQKCFIRIH